VTRKVLWIVGEPGVGKTTVARKLLELYGEKSWEKSLPKWTGFGSEVATAGWWRGETFDGSDTLPISQIKYSMQYWADELKHIKLAVLDGDKLANKGAVRVAVEQNAQLFAVNIIGEQQAAERRLARGSKQDETWIKGRRTKSSNFYRFLPEYGWQCLKYQFHADTPADQMAKSIKHIVDSGTYAC